MTNLLLIGSGVFAISCGFEVCPFP